MATLESFPGDKDPAPLQSTPATQHEMTPNGSTEPFFVDQRSMRDELLGKVIDTTTHETPIWPDYTFAFAPSYIVSAEGSVMEANTATRVATMIRNICHDPQASTAIEGDTGKLAKAPGASLKDMTRFVDDRVHVKNADTQLPRRTILRPQSLTSELAIKLRKHNDPIMQALDQIRDEYSGQIDDRSFDELQHNLLLATKQDTVKKIYKNYTSELQRAGSALIQLMTQ